MKLLTGVLKRRREQLGISQAEVAEGICHQSLLSRIERLNEISNITVLQKICERLQLNVSDVAKISDYAATPLSVIRKLIDHGKIDQADEYLNNTNLVNRIPTFAHPEYNVLAARIALAQERISDAMQLLQIALSDVEKHQMELTIEIFTEMGVAWLRQSEYINATECFERACGIIRSLSAETQINMALVIAYTYRHQAEMYLAVNNPQKAMERVADAIAILPVTTEYHAVVALQTLRLECAKALALPEEHEEAKMLVYAAAEFSKDSHLKDSIQKYLID